jgi:alpha-L-fucosidase
MIRLFLILCLSSFFYFLDAQDYIADWESLDSRPVPEWFTNAKFGIFIHWGVYSVPAYRPFQYDEDGKISKEGTYAEWYAPDVMYKPQLNNNWHKKTYGKDFTYFDFLPMFRAELYDPAEWAELFAEAGAKYVVLTSKHCEGFTLWPSKEKYSENWNAGDAGPKRDLLGELTNEVRQQGLKMGYYYSFLEYWTTPTQSWPENEAERNGYYVPREVWEKNHIPENEYIERVHFHVKELINDYQPDIFWPDAEWDYSEDQLKSKELLTWIYNNAPNKESIVVNDRWAKGTRGKHGGYYTTEYGHGSENVKKDHPWEECRGMGYSFGYNRVEGLEDYKSSEELLEILVKTVSSGGNFLLNIGPRADGTIPLIMQQRLKEIGKWLKKNGEAIYATRPWEAPVPLRDINPKAGDDILFTQKGEDLYVFLLNWKVNAVSLKNLGVHKDAAAYYLSGKQLVDMKVKKGSVVLELPPERDESITVVRIENAWIEEVE